MNQNDIDIFIFITILLFLINTYIYLFNEKKGRNFGEYWEKFSGLTKAGNDGLENIQCNCLIQELVTSQIK